MARARRDIDVGRLASAASRPGIDPRTWVTYAVVEELGFDPDEGAFADVMYEPSGDRETCLISSPYAGSGFGAWFPIEVGDTVLVDVAGGDSGNGPTIVARLWNAGDPPHEDFGDGEVPTQDVVVRAKSGQSIKLRTAGGGALDLEVEDDGDLTLKAGGAVLMQAGDQAFVRGNAQQQALDTFLTVLNAWAADVSTAVIGAGGSAPVSQSAFLTSIETLQTQLEQALSTKIKGE